MKMIIVGGKGRWIHEGDWGRRKENHVVGRVCNCWILIDCFHFIFVYLFFTISIILPNCDENKKKERKKRKRNIIKIFGK